MCRPARPTSIDPCPDSVPERLDAARMMPRTTGPTRSWEERSPKVARVAIFTDSASDLDPAEAAASGIHIVPLIVNFGDQSFRAGVDMSGYDFWTRMTAPDAPFPTTAASSPGDFKDAYEAAFMDGAEAIVSVHVAETLSGTIKSARIARDMLPDREIHVVDSVSASMATGMLARIGIEL